MSRVLESKLNKATKDQLIKKILEMTLEHDRELNLIEMKYADEKSSMQNEIKKLKAKVKSLEALAVESHTEEETIKLVLKERATAKSISYIYNKLNCHLMIDIEKSRIEEILNNLTQLEPKYLTYYNEQKKAYLENQDFNDEHLRVSELDGLLFMKDKVTEMMESTSDEDKKLEYLDYYMKLVDRITKLTKGINGNEPNVVVENNIMADYTKEDREKILNFAGVIEEEVGEEVIN